MGRKNTSIQALSALVIAILTIFLVLFSASNLSQQKREEKIQYRAYISGSGIDVDSSFEGDSERYWVEYNFVNTGITPAYEVKREMQARVNGEEIDMELTSSRGPTLMGHTQGQTLGFSISKELFDLVSKGSDNRLIIKITYKDYSGERHTFVEEFWSFESDGEYDFVIAKEYEE